MEELTLSCERVLLGDVMSTYRSAGVNIDAGNELVRRIKKPVRSTYTAGVLGDIGLFGALYRARFPGMRDPILVSSVDGVGTKLKIAFALNRHHTVGQDLVNHCVNDILTIGARPLFFMDYLATGRLVPNVAEKVIRGFVTACRENNCALIGGETAEMPGMYSKGEYDIAGMIVGIVERKKALNGKAIKHGDLLIGIPSTGLHTNGYSLARSVIGRTYPLRKRVAELGMTLGDALLAVHRSYFHSVYPLLQTGTNVKALSHVTGGGIVENTMRVIPHGLRLDIDWNAWERPAIFKFLQRIGKIPEREMRRAFNNGIGYVIVAPKNKADSTIRTLRRRGENPITIGSVVRA